MNPQKPCIECHAADQLKTTEPRHTTLGETCTQCHTTKQWKPSTFQHDAYKQVGKHATLACKECHPKGIYKGTSRECYSCHEKDYKKTTMPNHAGAQYNKTCESCHSQETWKWTDHDHDLYYKLRGTHKTLSCEQCHEKAPALGKKGFKGLDKACRSCHEDDYTTTKDPNHQLTGMGKRCEDCHTDEQWRPATLFDHERYFPLKRHKGHANRQCKECHTSPNGDYLLFDCLHCHTYQDMVIAHRGYAWSYNSKECYSCHPRGL